MVLRLIPVTKLVACGNHLGTMRNQNLFPPSIKYAIALPGSSDRMTKGDRHPNPLQVLDRVMACHGLLGLQILKLASLIKKKGGGGSRSSQHGAHRRVLGYFWKGGGSAGIRA